MNELKEKIARAIYDLAPCEYGGEYIDGHQVSPGGSIPWEQAKKHDEEFAPEYAEALAETAYREAEAALRAIEEAGYVVVPKDQTAKHMQQLAEVAAYAEFELTNTTEMRDTAFSLIKKTATRHLTEPRG